MGDEVILGGGGLGFRRTYPEQDSRTERTAEEIEASIRTAGRSIVIAAFDQYGLEDKGRIPLEIAELTAGDDPDAIDRTSAEFRAGAAFALEVGLNTVSEMVEKHTFPPAA